MTSRVTSRRHLLRDLPHTYVVLCCAAVAMSLLVLFFHYSSPIQRDSAVRPQLNELRPQLNEFDIDKRYAGSIITDAPRGDMCWERVLDNRTGNLWDKGYVKCRDVSAPSGNHQPSGMDATRLRDVGKAFRHEQ